MLFIALSLFAGGKGEKASGSASAASKSNSSAPTISDMKGIAQGKYPGQYELAEYEKLSGKKLKFAQNPKFDGAGLPPVAERLPKDVLIFPPYNDIGKYGGILRTMAKAPESSTSETMSIRHVNLVRMSDDLKAIVPDIAKDYAWNKDFTELTFYLREGHKWSDGEPFTSEDIMFWWEDIMLNKELNGKVRQMFVYGGEPIKVSAPNKTTVVFKFAVPAPGFPLVLATSYLQPFHPKHMLMQFHKKYTPDADKLAVSLGYKDWTQLFRVYYDDSKDCHHPLSGTKPMVVPTLETHVLYEETTEHRLYKANPYYHIVDTAGNQLPYTDEISEVFVEDREIFLFKITNGELDHKNQGLDITVFPTLKESEANGKYKVKLIDNGLSSSYAVALNPTHKDPVLRELFNNIKFKQALSLALNRNEINEIVYLGVGKPSQYLTGNPTTCSFITEEMKNYMADYNPEKAKALLDEIGLKKDKDGFRLRPDGKPLVIYFNFCTRISSEFVELVKEYWDAIGVRVELKEVNTDLYIKTMADNDNDISVWGVNGGEPPAFYNADIAPFKPLFSGGRLEFGLGVEWDKWYKSGGKDGSEPPKDIKDLYKMYEKFLTTEFNSKEYNKLAGQMSEIISKNLYLIGTAYNLKGPVVFGDRLKNAIDPTIKGYTYYYEYSTKPCQWYLE